MPAQGTDRAKTPLSIPRASPRRRLDEKSRGTLSSAQGAEAELRIAEAFESVGYPVARHALQLGTACSGGSGGCGGVRFGLLDYAHHTGNDQGGAGCSKTAALDFGSPDLPLPPSHCYWQHPREAEAPFPAP